MKKKQTWMKAVNISKKDKC